MSHTTHPSHCHECARLHLPEVCRCPVTQVTQLSCFHMKFCITQKNKEVNDLFHEMNVILHHVQRHGGFEDPVLALRHLLVNEMSEGAQNLQFVWTRMPQLVRLSTESIMPVPHLPKSHSSFAICHRGESLPKVKALLL